MGLKGKRSLIVLIICLLGGVCSGCPSNKSPATPPSPTFSRTTFDNAVKITDSAGNWLLYEKTTQGKLKYLVFAIGCEKNFKYKTTPDGAPQIIIGVGGGMTINFSLNTGKRWYVCPRGFEDIPFKSGAEENLLKTIEAVSDGPLSIEEQLLKLTGKSSFEEIWKVTHQ